MLNGLLAFLASSSRTALDFNCFQRPGWFSKATLRLVTFDRLSFSLHPLKNQWSGYSKFWVFFKHFHDHRTYFGLALKLFGQEANALQNKM